MPRDAKKKSPSRDREGPKRYTIRFSLAGLISLGLLLVAGLSWMFVMGVLVGRGYKPETAVPEIARFMPAPRLPNATSVLKPEELEFYDELRKTPRAPGREQNTKKSVPSSKPPKELSFTGVRPPKKTPKETIYNYVYQAAAFKDLKAAETFQSGLEKLGLSSGIEKAVSRGTTWYRVLVYFRGTPTDTRKLKQKLKTLGVKKALLRGKEPL